MSNCRSKATFLKNKITTTSVQEQRQANLAKKEPPCNARINKGNINLSWLLDTGAECTLISQQATGSIPGKRTTEDITQRSITGQPIVSTKVIHTVAIFNEVAFDVSLRVVEILPFNVVLDIDSLKTPGLKISITTEGVAVSREYNVCNNAAPYALYTDSDLPDTSQLIPILQRYENIFGMKTPAKKITTGSLSIWLKDPNRIVKKRL